MARLQGRSEAAGSRCGVRGGWSSQLASIINHTFPISGAPGAREGGYLIRSAEGGGAGSGNRREQRAEHYKVQHIK